MIRSKQDCRTLELKPLELYLHIPFCVRKCRYCDFLSGPADVCTQDAYMEALLEELKGRSEECAEYEVDTIFIGGGTPSVVKPEWIQKVMDTIRRYYQLSPEAEITMEMNPGTVDREGLEIYCRAGINRLSIGLQSANEEELLKLGRIHTFAQFQKTYRDAVDVGFTNINVDVMSALPEQTVESWRRTLEAVLTLDPIPQHISAYSLIVEEGTPLYDMQERGTLILPDEDSERQMYTLTEELLGQYGFRRYEISNYAREGYECRHNCGYWRRREYLGLGTGAASLMKECRFTNGTGLEEYLMNPLGMRSEVQYLTEEEQMEEFMFLGLRMMEGVSEKTFREAFGRELMEVYDSVIRKNVQDGLLEITRGEPAFYRLTHRGIDLSNYVMSQFLF
ncbi:MAG: oxygen-independent coproporphyrinogen III oxidase [Lachnospiraceae bacterium]|nr:oxygen-independent coproporphyrinogen III oxidase [Lachnospiraceae bacterium]